MFVLFPWSLCLLDTLKRYISSRAFQRRQYHQERTLARRVVKVLSYRWNEELYGPGAHSLGSEKGRGRGKGGGRREETDLGWGLLASTLCSMVLRRARVLCGNLIVFGWLVAGLGARTILKCRNSIGMLDCAWSRLRERWQRQRKSNKTGSC